MSSSEDSPIKDSDAQGRGKRRMRGSVWKKKLFAVDGHNKDSACSSYSNDETVASDTVTSSSLQGNSKGALTPNLWSEVQCEKVSKLPYDIDGLVKYELGFEKERRMESSRDGRPWAGFMTSRRSGFFGTRRLARCKGSPKCINDDCPYLSQYSKRNRVQFQFQCGENICHSCGAPAVNIPCPASKV